MDISSAKKYFVKEGLEQYFQVSTEKDLDSTVANKKLAAAIPPHLDDLARIHQLIRKRKSFTVLEFGVGFSTIVIADALRKNELEWSTLDKKPAVRNRFMFKNFSVDSSKEWIDKSKERMPEILESYVEFHFSRVKIGTHNGQLCHFYESLPDIVPDFIYIDGPDPKTVEGSINGLTFQCDERTVMAGDLLLMEPILLPGTFIIIDGRTNNARFLQNNLKRNYIVNWERDGDVTTFELNEERLGKYNILGSDFLK